MHIHLTLGASGHPELERAWLEKALEIFETFCAKQHDYGSNNIAKHGEMGVVVRADDKFERLRNLLRSENPPSNEALRDSWIDLAGYGIIGLMCRDGDWPKPTEREGTIDFNTGWSFRSTFNESDHNHHHPNPED